MAIYKNTPPIVTNGLVMNLDAGNRQSYVSGSTTWRDLSGNEYNGTLTNSPTFNTSNLGNISFISSSQQYINCGTYTLTSAVDFTVTSWFNKTASTVGFLFSIDASSCGNSPMTYVAIDTIITCRYETTTSSNLLSSSISVNDSNWHSVSYVRSGANSLLYIDGILNNTLAITGTAGTGTKNMLIGTRQGSISNPAGCGATYLTANIATMMFYSRALSAQEVAQNYNALKSRFSRT
jgi:hypothetical protein